MALWSAGISSPSWHRSRFARLGRGRLSPSGSRDVDDLLALSILPHRNTLWTAWTALSSKAFLNFESYLIMRNREFVVARMEGPPLGGPSIRDQRFRNSERPAPDFAALHPGYQAIPGRP